MDSIFEKRLRIVLELRKRDEEYYKNALRSKGVQLAELTHEDICAFKTAIDIVEADIIIAMCELTEQTDREVTQKLKNILEKRDEN